MCERSPIRCFSRTIDPPGNVAALRQAIAVRDGGAMLESHGETEGGRYSVYAWEPIRRLTVAASTAEDPFAGLAGVWPSGHCVEDSDVPFVGGWIGFLAYEAGRFVEPSGGW